jgi:ABC-2 type transport system ATP-binding protein
VQGEPDSATSLSQPEASESRRTRPPAVRVEGVVKRFGSTTALAGVDLEVPEGMVFGLLGPNGAGKTTLVRILATLLVPDAGRAELLGHDVVAESSSVRELLALTGQFAAVDELLTGRENLEMFGRLFRLSRAEARRRASELLERFELADAADRPAKTYSGGMRRRLDLAASLIISPPVLFLDEPTTGLDPRSRLAMWEIIGELVGGGTTVLLTTQYLDEADQLADRIAVVDGGRVIATGTSQELKAQVGGERLEITLGRETEIQAAVRLLRPHAAGEVHADPDRRRMVVPVTDGGRLLATVVRELDEADLRVEDLALRQATLDDVFLTLTGHAAEVPEAIDATPDRVASRRERKEAA